MPQGQSWHHVRVGLREDLTAKWSADRQTRRTWLLLALFGVVVAVLDLVYLDGPLRVVLGICFGIYAIICVIQGARTRKRP